MINEKEIKSAFDMDFNSGINEIFEDMTNKITEIREDLLINDIINIYNGEFGTYKEYIDSIARYNELVKKERDNYFLEITSTYRYTPEKTALTEKTFNHIRDMAMIRGKY